MSIGYWHLKNHPPLVGPAMQTFPQVITCCQWMVVLMSPALVNSHGDHPLQLTTPQSMYVGPGHLAGSS